MNKIISINSPKSPISEAYRGIRTNIEFSNLDKEIKVIGVTSSKQSEGKSTVIANLAVSFAALEKKVLILDGDLRNPSVHRMFGLSNIHGVTDVLLEKHNFVDCVHSTEDINKLNVLTCGQIPPNPSEMLSSKRMRNFVDSLREYYDYIFIDTPPIGIITDAGIISTYTDGMVFVVSSNEVDINQAKIAKERLDAVGANILGTVLNKFEAKRSGNDYYNYYYEEHDSRGKSEKRKNKRKKKKEKAMS